MKDNKVILGCMGWLKKTRTEINDIFACAMDNRINTFDHADIYGGSHACERIFGENIDIRGSQRELVNLQTKCGIRKGYFDFSRNHIIESVEESLAALDVEYIDTLLLHRPDTLVEEDEIADAFSTLNKSGKVLSFGVSNCNPMQIELLQKYIGDKIKIKYNQIQLSLGHTAVFDSGFCFNTIFDNAIDRTGSIVEYARLKDITLQAWSPMQFGFFDGVFYGNEKYSQLTDEIDKLADKYSVHPTTIIIAWILRHPANIQPVIGTTNPDRIKYSAEALNIELTRQEWYSLYTSAGNKLP